MGKTLSGQRKRDIYMNNQEEKSAAPAIVNNPDYVRPAFPKRAVITAGMPYGNKELHLGHIGGVFIHADTFARFLKDRIGPDNVVFVSGTDCYGSPILEYYRQVVAKGDFKGTIDPSHPYVLKGHVPPPEPTTGGWLTTKLQGSWSLELKNPPSSGAP